MKLVRQLFRASPKPTKDGAYSPSTLALAMATSPKTDFDGGEYAHPNQSAKRKVIMVCTEERNMVMANGKLFSTGNHPVEMGLPMLHLLNAGFEIEVATPTGAPAQIEKWAIPEKDDHIQKLLKDFAQAFETPIRLSDCVANAMTDPGAYAAVFLPGGHGAMLGLPDNPDLGKLLCWAHAQDVFTLAICHGPAALLSVRTQGEFIYSDYEIAAFPDSVDQQTPLIGYMPGHMPWKFGEALEQSGITIINDKADDTCHMDRRLITGAGPKAANNFGRLAATKMLEAFSG